MECFPITDGSNKNSELSCEDFSKQIQLPFILSANEPPEMPIKFFPAKLKEQIHMRSMNAGICTNAGIR